MSTLFLQFTRVLMPRIVDSVSLADAMLQSKRTKITHWTAFSFEDRLNFIKQIKKSRKYRQAITIKTRPRLQSAPKIFLSTCPSDKHNIKSGCPKPKGSCPKCFAQNSKTIGHIFYLTINEWGWLSYEELWWSRRVLRPRRITTSEISMILHMIRIQ